MMMKSFRTIFFFSICFVFFLSLKANAYESERFRILPLTPIDYTIESDREYLSEIYVIDRALFENFRTNTVSLIKVLEIFSRSNLIDIDIKVLKKFLINYQLRDLETDSLKESEIEKKVHQIESSQNFKNLIDQLAIDERANFVLIIRSVGTLHDEVESSKVSTLLRREKQIFFSRSKNRKYDFLIRSLLNSAISLTLGVNAAAAVSASTALAIYSIGSEKINSVYEKIYEIYLYQPYQNRIIYQSRFKVKYDSRSLDQILFTAFDNEFSKMRSFLISYLKKTNEIKKLILVDEKETEIFDEEKEIDVESELVRFNVKHCEINGFKTLSVE